MGLIDVVDGIVKKKTEILVEIFEFILDVIVKRKPYHGL